MTYSTNNESSSKSRYKVLRKITSEEYEYLETQNQRFIKETDGDTYHIVTQDEVNRLDIIANKYYGDPKMWWIIALANEMIDPFIVEKDIMIRIPSINTVYDKRERIMNI